MPNIESHDQENAQENNEGLEKGAIGKDDLGFYEVIVGPSGSLSKSRIELNHLNRANDGTGEYTIQETEPGKFRKLYDADDPSEPYR